MDFRLPHEERARTDAIAVANSAHATGGEDQPKPSRRRRHRHRWKLPITDGPFAESKEMVGGSASRESSATDV
jgi:hypothetical protein